MFETRKRLAVQRSKFVNGWEMHRLTSVADGSIEAFMP